MKRTVIGAALAGVLFSTAVSAQQAGDFIVRAGSATVRPTESSDNVLGLGGFNIDNNTQLGLTFTYMATDNIGVELLAATPFRHKVGLNSTGDIASVRQLPPSLMAQYYFGEAQDKLRPYIGVGLNYTTFFDEKFNQTGRDAGLSDLSLKDSWGIAGQAGLDYNLNDNWLINMSVWYMDIDTKVRFKAGEEQQSIHTDINPWVFMFAVGYRF
ncbi:MULTISPECIES: outer membrane protein OmpW [Sodalis]|jgi:outer membrane protein|uniref:Outer membrane protein W n=1 Tax=Sodalis ligni TaxID=2697027 RepID=A0A4R1NCY4_9GAMM|nr:outer membrane protein OmpW [Sodalis ligni]TCL02446.1 outer membrane protein [Sodalis ligni]